MIIPELCLRLRASLVVWVMTNVSLACGESPGRPTDQTPLTVAEKSNYERTARDSEVVAFINEVAAQAGHVRPIEFGKTVERRPLVGCVASGSGAAVPEHLRAGDTLVVLLLGNIHSGECAGKEALLMLLREVAKDRNHRWLKELVLIFAPNYNADGNERMSKTNRPNQVGPSHGTGERANAQGIDLNRDFIKLEAPETQSLVRLIQQWNPHVVIDTHTTNGSKHRYQLTYDVPHNPATPASIREYLRSEMMTDVTARCQQGGIATFYYGNFDREYKRWTTYGHQPRYSTEYVGIRGRLGILAEAYSYISYKKRIEATKVFVAACLDHLAENRKAVLELVGNSEQRLIDAGKSPAIGDLIAIRSSIGKTGDSVTIKGYLRDGSAPKDHQVEFHGTAVATKQVQRPRGYLIPRELAKVVDKLLQHGVRVEQLAEDATVTVEVSRIEKFSAATNTFQGHRLRSATSTARTDNRTVRQGSYLVPSAQPLGNLISYLLECESDDGLLTWNVLDSELSSGAEYPVLKLIGDHPIKTHPVDSFQPAGKLTLDAIYGPEGRRNFTGRFLAVSWLDGIPKYARRRGGVTSAVDAETGAVTSLYDEKKAAAAFEKLPGISSSTARRLGRLSGATFSADRNSAVLRHRNDLYYYHFERDSALRLTNSTQPEEHISFSPDGKLVAFVRDHNLHVAAVVSGKEWPITSEGTSELLHGELDWVYQEEVYGRGQFKAYWWSPDSSRIAFLRLDESPVLEYTVTDHIPVRGRQEVTRYPKAGDPLPHVDVGIIAIEGGNTVWLNRSNYDPEAIVARVSWTPDSQSAVVQLQNRLQTWLDLLLVNPETGSAKKLLRETSPAWVEVLGTPYWLEDGSFIWLSDRTGWRHIYKVSPDGATVQPVTKGEWEVSSIKGVSDNGTIYFEANKDSFTASNAYCVGVDGSEMKRLTSGGGNHAVRFDDTMSYFVDYWSDVHTPIQTHLYRADGSLLRSLEPNLTDGLRYYDVSRPEFHQVPTGDGATLEAMLIKPPDFNPAQKYPVLVYVYSGPQAPVVRDRWAGSTYLWHQMLAQNGYLIWMCDNRSASTKGIHATWPIYKETGKHELADIETGLAWLKQKPWVDPARIGIWGWSYGGYMTGYALTHSKSFRLGISGAPVTDWKNYDAIYTERYMGLPGENSSGYKGSSVVEAAGNLHGKLLLVHGSTDDNVHLSNTMQLVYALQKAGKQFELMIYPRNRHGISDPLQVRHLRERMTQFILSNL